jgi:hypothetical protein
MFKSEIRHGVNVIDKTLGVTYTWRHAYGNRCMLCASLGSWLLVEDEPIVNAWGDSYRSKCCVDCAGLDNLQVIVKKISKCENCGEEATVYAMDTCAGGWGGRYCDSHIPTGFTITDRL